MNEEKSRKILSPYINQDNSLSRGIYWAGDIDRITIDDMLTIDDIQAISWWVNNMTISG